MIKTGLAAVLCAGAVYVGGWRVGPLPPLGPFLDPVRGIWSIGSAIELPDSAADAVPGLTAAVQVVYDHRRVPHIFGESIEDVVRALGYVVARDRLFQLELQTRATAGTLSALVGPAALEIDRAQRALGLAWSAERHVAELDTTTVDWRLLHAYADGVNAWIDALSPRDLPLEFHILGARPQRWRPVFAMYLMKRMGYTLSYSSLERRRRIAEALVGPDAADALFPLHSPIQEPIQPNGRARPRFDGAALPPPGPPSPTAARLLRNTRGIAGSPARDRSADVAIGSNNWAVGPIKSATGHAILAGDPHLDLTLPSIWYEVHMVVPGELDVYGVTIPGAPGVVIGFNRDVAWSFTNTGADVTDWYRETVDDEAAPARYRLDGGWQPLERRIETYRDPRGRILATDTVLHTHRGPVFRIDGEYLSLRWTLLDAQGELPALRQAANATTVDEWLAAFETYVAPTQNGIVADRHGSIAIRASGWYPIRPEQGRGDRIFDGTDSGNDWTGYLPVRRYPFAIDPPQGFLASANQEPVDPRATRDYLGADWPSPWRAMRINALLRESTRLTPADLQAFQTDPGNARADRFAPAFAAAAARMLERSDDPLLRDAAARLNEWDRRYTKTNTRAVLFETAMTELSRRTWDELRDPDREGRLAVTPASAILAALLDAPESPWWDDRTTDAVEHRDQILAASLREAFSQVRARYGDDGEAWRWDRIRHANIYHLLRLPGLSALRLPVRGGPGNLNPSSGSGTHGASWRMVVELADTVTAWAVYPGGQSGNPLSARYTDRIGAWTNGELEPVTFPLTRDEIPADSVTSRLTLRRTGSSP